MDVNFSIYNFNLRENKLQRIVEQAELLMFCSICSSLVSSGTMQVLLCGTAVLSNSSRIGCTSTFQLIGADEMTSFKI